MKIGDAEFERFRLFMDGEHEKSRKIEVRRILADARSRLSVADGSIDAIAVATDGKLAALDMPFKVTKTFLPSAQLRTQLRLASHYLFSADQANPPGLPSFVVLRVAIECIATAHWLMSGDGHRDGVERVLKRMWWDSQSAAEMATVVDGDPDQSALGDLRSRIIQITASIKRLDSEIILDSRRERLSKMVENASRDLHPDQPSIMHATWMLCAGVSHGNIAISAGAGLSAALIQEPAKHLIDEAMYAQVLSAAVDDLEAAVEAFRAFAAQQHSHQRPDSA